jgi:biotin operon repressor
MRNDSSIEYQSHGLFGTITRTQTLLLIGMLGETHSGEIARLLGRSPSRIKDAVDGLENEGIIIGASVGAAKRLSLNPRYVAAQELKSLITKLGSSDLKIQERVSTIRRRPRKTGKEI